MESNMMKYYLDSLPLNMKTYIISRFDQNY